MRDSLAVDSHNIFAVAHNSLQLSSQIVFSWYEKTILFLDDSCQALVDDDEKLFAICSHAFIKKNIIKGEKE